MTSRSFARVLTGVIVLGLLLALSSPYLCAVGTNTGSAQVTGRAGVHLLQFQWIGSATDGTVPQATSAFKVTGWVFRAATIPDGVTVPTDAYDVDILDESHKDIFGGLLNNQPNLLPKFTYPAAATNSGVTSSVFVDSLLSAKVLNNSVTAASGTVKVYWAEFPVH